MRISKDLVPIRLEPPPSSRPSEMACADPPCTALIPVAPTPRRTTGTFASPRPSASFLTQLLAVAENLPGTRERRRATDMDAHLAYRASGLQIAAPRDIAPASRWSRSI